MSKKRRTAEQPSRIPPSGVVVATALDEAPLPGRWPWWMYAVAFLVALITGFEIYGPALRGEFLFDDQYLPFLRPEVQNAPIEAWLGVRPFLMLSYWLNYNSVGVEPYWYHVVNVPFHCANAILVWVIIRRLLKTVGEVGFRLEAVAAFAGALFLLHPIQTESVAYVSSRSEAMSIFFFLLAYVVFPFRPDQKVSLLRAAAVLVLFGMACTVKEHTTVLPVLLLLTDYWFTTPFRVQGILRNRALYSSIAVVGAAGVYFVWRMLQGANSAGFGLQQIRWYEYLFTQFRIIWNYVRLFVFPAGQNGDYVLPVSHTLFEHGAVFGLIALLVVSVAAWWFRREFPLASFGWFGFLVLLAPTSSVVPIMDVMTERRLYLPFFCLLLIAVDFIRRWKVTPALLASALGVVLAVSAFAAYQRNQVWSSALLFWSDAAAKTPSNSRARFQLAYAQWQAGQCADAVRTYEETSKLTKVDDRLLVDWALALECLGQTDAAIAKLRQADALAPSALVQAQIGMVYGKKGRAQEAMEALDKAEKLDPNFDMIYVYKGNLAAARGAIDEAITLYQRALALNPRNNAAENALLLARQAQVQSTVRGRTQAR